MAKIKVKDSIEISLDDEVTWPYDIACQITDWDQSSGETEQIDTQTVCEDVKSYVSGDPDYGTFSLNGFYDPAATSIDAIEDLHASGATAAFRITMNDTGASTRTFDGNVSNFSVSAAAGNLYRFSTTIKLTGAVTRA